MSNIYQTPREYFFRLHHVRPRFKNNVEEVLLYMATSISDLPKLPENQFNKKLNSVIRRFGKNSQSEEKTINNWRTEISALFSFIQEENGELFAGKIAKRLSENQYLDEFFNYFLYSFQYPAGHSKSDRVIEQIKQGIKFKPCQFILSLLKEGERLQNKPFSITAEELTQCAYFDLRVTRGVRSAQDVAKLILKNRENKVEYDHQYPALEKKGKYPSRGDVYRYAGDILDYMVLAELLTSKNTGYYYCLNQNKTELINKQLDNSTWCDIYDQYYQSENIQPSDITALEPLWFDYTNSFDEIDEFKPSLDSKEQTDIAELIRTYQEQLSIKSNVPVKIVGDYGETLVMAHEYLRTKEHSKRQHLINKIPTPLGVGYDLQSIEIEKHKRYIEVKTTKSKKAINSNRFKLTPNEWDSAETLGEHYFIYYLVINENKKKIFVIQNPAKQYEQGNLRIDNNFMVEFSDNAGTWQDLLEVC